MCVTSVHPKTMGRRDPESTINHQHHDAVLLPCRICCYFGQQRLSSSLAFAKGVDGSGNGFGLEWQRVRVPLFFLLLDGK